MKRTGVACGCVQTASKMDIIYVVFFKKKKKKRESRECGLFPGHSKSSESLQDQDPVAMALLLAFVPD